MTTKHPESTTIRGALVGLGVVAIAAVFALGLLPGMARVAEAKQAPRLNSWSTARIMDELGDYDQRVDCAEFGLQGLTGYVWVKVDTLTGQPTRFLFLCKP